MMIKKNGYPVLLGDNVQEKTFFKAAFETICEVEDLVNQLAEKIEYARQFRIQLNKMSLEKLNKSREEKNNG
jgi:hypothetical protein